MSDLIRYTTDAGEQFYCTAGQAEALDMLASLHKGGIGTVYGYKPSSDWKVSPTVNLQIITRFSTSALYQRKQLALDAIKFADILPHINADPVLKNETLASLEAVFNERKAGAVASMQQTLDGDRSDNRRQGHDRCHISIAEGVKVNLVTDKGDDGLKYPVLADDGLPTAKTILVHYLELRRETVVEGVRKVVNSGVPVRVSNCIDKVLNKRSVGIRSLSLQPENFETIKIGRQTFTKADLVAEMADDSRDDANLLFEALGLD